MFLKDELGNYKNRKGINLILIAVAAITLYLAIPGLENLIIILVQKIKEKNNV
ncbi:hypothetical protein KAZ01_00470 [Candidatus Gracilibacteria bacterium]|nr:hypothetical protein [Candidatus Gracilibacteria bacterium]